jgi:uncharacterized membrane protein YvlD (DUF360 family)
MRKIINFLLTMFVLWVGSQYFYPYIRIDSTKTLIIATVLMFAMSIAFGYIMLLSAFLTPILIGCLPLLITVILVPFLKIIELWILNKYLVGFHIYGFGTYVLLGVIMFIFSIEIKTKTK